MKKFLSIVVIGILVLSGIVAVAKNSQTNSSLYNASTFDDPVPDWNAGYIWTYTVNNITVNYTQGEQNIFIDGKIDDFSWKVTDTNGSYYTVAVTGKITATYDFSLSYQTSTIHFVGSFKPALTRLTGTIQFTKSDLEIHDFLLQLKGISVTKINSIPSAIPIPFKLITEGDLSVDFPLFDFPLNGDKFWNLPDLTITMSSTFGGIFGIIQIPFTVGVNYGWVPFAFFCHDKQDVTVEAGTYSAYEITSPFFEWDYYYAPIVGNLVKINAVLTNGKIHGELKSTNYP